MTNYPCTINYKIIISQTETFKIIQTETKSLSISTRGSTLAFEDINRNDIILALEGDIKAENIEEKHQKYPKNMLLLLYK